MKLTIIIPTYKRPKELIKCINSILIQDYKNFEIIIINDSPDYDYQDVDIYIKNLDDERIKYFKNNENKGVNYSRNKGIDLTSENTDYINFLDDDDILLENSIEEQLKLLDNKDWLMTLSKTKQNINFENIRISEDDKFYNYLKDYLLLRTIKGDYNQVLNYKIIKKNNVRFSNRVKQAEEWVFSMRASRYMKTYVKNIYTMEKEYLVEGLTQEINNLNSFKKRWFVFTGMLKTVNEVFWEGFYPLEKVYIFIKILRGIQKLLF